MLIQAVHNIDDDNDLNCQGFHALHQSSATKLIPSGNYYFSAVSQCTMYTTRSYACMQYTLQCILCYSGKSLMQCRNIDHAMAALHKSQNCKCGIMCMWDIPGIIKNVSAPEDYLIPISLFSPADCVWKESTLLHGKVSLCQCYQLCIHCMHTQKDTYSYFPEPHRIALLLSFCTTYTRPQCPHRGWLHSIAHCCMPPSTRQLH